MADLPQTPSTEAGKALLAWVAGKGDDTMNIRDHILAIEAEARANNECHITALRSVLDDVGRWIAASDGPQSIIDDIARASRDTASTATEERERIEKPWREALLRIRHLAAQRAHLDSTLGDIFDEATRSLLNSDTEGQLEEGNQP